MMTENQQLKKCTFIDDINNSTYKIIFKGLPMAACIVDSNTMLILDQNTAFSDVLSAHTQIKNSNVVDLLTTTKFDEEAFKKTFNASIINRTELKIKLNSLDTTSSVQHTEWTIQPVSSTEVLIIASAVSFSKDSLGKSEKLQQIDSSVPFTTAELVDLFQKAPIGIHSTAADGSVLWANDYLLGILGYDRREYVGHKAVDFMVNKEEYLDIFEMIKRGTGCSKNIRLKMLSKAGDVKYLVVDSTACYNPDGTFSHTRSFARDDVDELINRVTIQDQLEKVSMLAKEKDRFIRIMFHELSTPLHILANTTGELSNSLVSGSLSPKVITADILHQVDKCLGLVEDLSFAMMFESDNVVKAHPVKLDLRKELENILKHMGIMQQRDGHFHHTLSKDLRFSMNIDASVLETVCVDKSILRVLYNLVMNATKYCSVRGTIAIALSYAAENKPDDQKKVGNCGNSTTGNLHFSITNSVNAPMDLVYVNKLFQNYLHSNPALAGNEATRSCSVSTSASDEGVQQGSSEKSDHTPSSNTHSNTISNSGSNVNSGSASSSAVHKSESRIREGIAPTCSSGTMSNINTPVSVSKFSSKVGKLLDRNADTSASTRSNLSVLESLSKSLVSSDGLGLGLYVSYNIVQSLGGLLECSTTDSESCFEFSLPIYAAPSGEVCGCANGSEHKHDHKHEKSSPKHLMMREDSWSNVNRSAVGSKHVTSLRERITLANGNSLKLPPLTIDAPGNGIEAISSSDVIINTSCSNLTLRNSASGSLKRSPAPVIGASSRVPRILVVDDSPICRKVLVKSLEDHGYATDVACDGQEACDKLGFEPCLFDAVLMDLRMPIMDGITATRLCKDRKHLANTPIIIVTAELGEEVRSAAFEARADYFISKPAKMDELLEVLQQYVGSSM